VTKLSVSFDEELTGVVRGFECRVHS